MRNISSNTGSPFYPIFLRLKQRQVLVIGGNIEAERKVRRLSRAGAQITVIADALTEDLAAFAADGVIEWMKPPVEPRHLGDRHLIVVADAAPATLEWVRDQAERQGVPFNAVDQLEQCSAIVPSVVDRSPLMIAVSSAGTAPELARMTRSRIERMLRPGSGRLASLLSELRVPIRTRYPEIPKRRQFLNWAMTGPPADAADQGDDNAAANHILESLADQRQTPTGEVMLVGAGPGDPELLTLRALRAIQSADVIAYDGLMDPSILDYARRDAKLLSVAKRAGDKGIDQAQICELLIEHASSGARVIRLKGGDPLIFGRAGEEIDALQAADVRLSIIPGITAASGAAAALKMPLTQRDRSQSVRLVTAHCAKGIDCIDWAALAAEKQTLAFYMGISTLDQVEHNLIAHGRSPETPVAIVENASQPMQRRITGQLGELSSLAHAHQLVSPAITFIGEVAASVTVPA
ncbi:siroheme synthase CysG [Spiribacter roseus]|uniref:Siroheme synthase CysG n=1 Tax=Spiribacter roseus TaxID=1855875 RepID=A0ABV3S1H8_9GAMM